MQNRFKSKVLWAAIAAQVFAIVALTGLDQTLGIDMGAAGDIVASVLQLLVLFGILNSPTDSENF
jgi:uncharacterized membrane protein